jgi:hypothetical protein
MSLEDGLTRTETCFMFRINTYHSLLRCVLLYSFPSFDKILTSFDYETTNGRHREVTLKRF